MGGRLGITPPGAAPGQAVALAGALVGTLQLARTMGPEGAGLLLLTQGKAALLAQYAVS